MIPLSFVAGIALADATSSRDFDAGIRFFGQENYHQALDAFRRAENAGMQTPDLFYNLGSVLYKLGRYADSKSYFNRLVDDSTLGALAYYNLGLIAHREGKRPEAIEYFDKCAATTDDTALRELAFKQIDTLGGRPVKSWYAYASAGYGYDSNITVLPSTAASEVSGNYLHYLALADWTLNGNATRGLHATAIYVARDFRESGNFDDSSLSLGLEFHHPVEAWQFTYGVELGNSTYGNDDYLADSILRVTAKTSPSNNRELRLGLQLDNISSRSGEFDYLDGSRQSLTAAYRLKSASREYRLEYGLEANDRRDTAIESFSPTRNELGARYFDNLSRRLRIGAGIDFRISDYETLPTQDRADRRTRIRLDGRYKIDTTWTARAELVYTDNQSTEPASEYDKYQAEFSISGLF